ncbi:uncharacterized protein PAC_04383 [Phialocephala subalpina]|uniref:RING-type domain-containing protein n=1 Tax=Phialocephala subalpina TaxID=576137 RepID=A0A1L7WP00_9HELO|nr:uncharacterized protein PAC_04383 [Phialocephala subalpina]
MATVWDARSVLDVYPESSTFTCVGTTLQGRRCQNSFIKKIYKEEASDILDGLPALVRSTRRYAQLLPTLKHLAFLTLCPRWHQERKPQVDPVAQRWLAMIQNLGVMRSSRTALPTPPPTPPPITRRARDTSTSRSPQRHNSIHTDSTYRTPPSTTTSLNNGEASAHTSRRRRDVNISFNIAVDSNQIIREHATTRAHGSPSSSISSTSSSSGSSRSTRSSSSRSTSSSSSSSNSQPSRDSVELQIAALQRQIAALTQVVTAQAHSSRSSRASSRSINPGSPVPSVISNFELPLPRSPIRASALEVVDESEDSEEEESSSESDGSNYSDDSDSESDSDPPAPGPGINTPSSSGRSSPVVVSPPRSPARSAAPNPSSASSASSVPVRRRPITADTTCYVCYEPIASAAEAAWCRGSCGQNICLTCFAEWITEQTSNGRRIACGLWYVFLSSRDGWKANFSDDSRAPWRF